MTTTQQPPAAPRENRVVDKAQYGLAAGIGIAGAYVIYDATTMHKGFADQTVQPYAVPVPRGSRPSPPRSAVGVRHGARRCRRVRGG